MSSKPNQNDDCCQQASKPYQAPYGPAAQERQENGKHQGKDWIT
jgi:hypothetical protein